MDNREIALAADMASSEGGGGGGTTDYADLSNKPEINGNQLIGNKMAADLGLQPTVDTTHKLDADLVDDSTSGHKFAWSGTQAAYAQAAASIPAGTPVIITDDTDIDTVPTQGSNNPVTSDGIYRELAKLKVINENPENHNGIYRGKDLTNIYTVEQIYERVHDGSFEDLYLGDYFTVHLTTDLYTRFTGSAFVEGTTYYEMGGTVVARTWTETQDAEPQEGKVYATKQVVEEDVDYMIAGFDVFLHTGHTAPGTSTIYYVTDHHLVLIPKMPYITNAVMHSDATALTGYANSDMHQITIPCYVESTKVALNNHLLKRIARLSAVVNKDIPSAAGAGYNGAVTSAPSMWIYSAIMSDIQAFGTTVLSSSFYEVGLDYERFPLFQFISPVEIFSDYSSIKMWLRTIAFVTNISSIGDVVYYAIYSSGGNVTMTACIDSGCKVRPYYLFG